MLGEFHPMIVAGTSPLLQIDLGNDEPGMILQYRDIESGYIVWRDVLVDGEVVKSPVDINGPPVGVYRLRICWTIKSMTVAVTIAPAVTAVGITYLWYFQLVTSQEVQRLPRKVWGYMLSQLLQGLVTGLIIHFHFIGGL